MGTENKEWWEITNDDKDINEREITNSYLVSHCEPWDRAWITKESRKLNDFSSVCDFLHKSLKKYREIKNQENDIKKLISYMEESGRSLFSQKTRSTYLTELQNILVSTNKEELMTKLKEGIELCGHGIINNKLKCILEVAHYVLKVKDKQVEKEGIKSTQMMSLNHSHSDSE